MPGSPDSLAGPSDQGSQLRRLASGRLLVAAFPPALRMASAFLQLGATILIARRLGEDSSAIFFFWSAVLMSMAMIATFGLDKLALQQVPRLAAQPAQLGRFLASLRVLSLLLSVVLGLGLIFYAGVVQHDHDHPMWWYALLPISLVALVLCKLNAEALKGLERPMLAIHYRNLLPGSVFLAALLVMGSNLDPHWAMACFALGFAVAGFGSLWSSAFASYRPHFRMPRRVEAREQIGLGMPICVGAILNSLTYIVPLAILERCGEAREIAFLTTAYRLFVLFELLSVAVHSIWMPQLSRAAHAEDWPEAWKIFRAATVQGLLLLGIPLLGATIFSGSVMSLFGDGFVDGQLVLKVFLIFGLLSLLLGPADDLVIMMGHAGMLARFTAANLAVTLLLSFFMIPHFGAVGMAAVFGGGLLLKKALCLWHFSRFAHRTRGGRTR
jgi:O-antigen/teichoic acid export membrane protein